jgi:parvulin-like peptidyl-prolyl isomerase
MAVAMAPAAPAAAQAAPGGEVFAVVGEKSISFQDYRAALAAGMRQKFYHAKPPEGEEARFQREVGDQLVNQALLLDEAKRRGIEPDSSKIEETVSGYDRRYQDSEQWKANRERLLPGLRERLERQSLLERLERAVRTAPASSEDGVRAYYAAHPELFTEPEQVRLSLILLKVDPSSPRQVWDQAREEAGRIHQRLQKGADFAELARLHSADPSSAKGGDLGYVHRGMLPETIQREVIDTLKPGAASAPVTLLEGVAIVRLDGQRPARRHVFEDVRARAADLWAREQGEQAWKRLIAELRSRTRIQIDESRFLPLPPT